MSSLSNRTEYAKHYDDFRGVDFSSDHTKVADNRFSYLVNMYKDYQSAQGHAIETIPGFRKRGEKLSGAIYGIHRFKHRDTSGNIVQKIVIHHNKSLSLFTPEHYKTVVGEDGKEKQEWVEDAFTAISLPTGVTMNSHKSTSFVFNNRLHILDGQNFLVYDGTSVKDFADTAYIPSVYINTIISGENANAGTEYEQRNLASPYYKQTFVADGKTETEDGALGYNGSTYYKLSIKAESVHEVYVYGEKVPQYNAAGTECWKYEKSSNLLYFCWVKDVSGTNNTRENNIPKQPEKCGYPMGYAGVEIIAKAPITKITGGSDEATVSDWKSIIFKCTIAAIYDNRVFLSGSPDYPNHVFYCGINGATGYVDSSYWGVLNYFQEGVGNSPVTAMIPLADSLLVLKGDTQQDGSIYYHKRTETGDNLVPVIYPSTPGLNGTGCLGAAVNFLDDPVFISRFGLEGVGQLSVRYERAIEHRSSLIDAMLLNTDLTKATLEEWNGYLILLADGGKIFMADSRQRYTHESGVMQYEWYYLEDIGVYEGQRQIYYYSDGTEVEEDYTVSTETETDNNGKTITKYYITKDSVKVYVTPSDEMGYGTFDPATIIREIDGNLYFGTAKGHLCSFNFDQRNSETHEIPNDCYTFNGRRYLSGCATKMDCCGIPHLTKSTVNRSTVIKTKALSRASAKIGVRTNNNPSKQIARINASQFAFDSLDFSDFTANTSERSIYAIKEKEKQWVEKQYSVYSDDFRAPFALFYISYRYYIAGRIKTQGGEI